MTKTKKLSSDQLQLPIFQNKVRGAIGSVRSKAFEKNPKDKALRDRSHINRIIAEARQYLDNDTYTHFLTWSASHVTRFAPTIDQARYHFNELGIYSPKRSSGLQREIAAASSRIALHTELIAEFRSLADRVECAFWESNENEIDLGLQAIEDAFGQSLWLLECRIAYKQVFHGLEAQKKYVQDVRKVATAGIAGNVAYYLSVKNEPNVSHTRFSTDLERRLLKAPVPESAKIYLNVRLADRWPSTPAGFAGILQVEQTTSIFDLYETLIKTAQRLVAEDASSEILEALAQELSKLQPVGDFRIAKLLLALGRNNAADGLQKPSFKSTDDLLRADYSSAWINACKSLRNDRFNLNELVAASLSVTPRKTLKVRGTTLRTLIERVSIALSKAGDFDRVSNDLTRFSQNLSFFPSIKALRQLCELECFAQSEATSFNLTLRFLNNAQLDARDLVSGLTSVRPDLIASITSRDGSLTERAIRRVAGVDGTTISEDESALNSMITAWRGLQRGEQQRLDQLKTFIDDYSIPRPIRIHLALRLIGHLMEYGDQLAAVEITAHQFVVEPSVSRVLPVSELIGSDGWRSLKSISGHLSVPIILDLSWRGTNDDKMATYRRFATQQFLARNGMTRPSDVRATVDAWPKAELIYFLNAVCIDSVMDMLPSMSNSQELQEERRRMQIRGQ